MVFRNTGDVAMPSLPATYFTFSVPYDAYNFTVTATASGSELLTVPALAYPIQQSRSFNDTTQITTQPDSIVYNTNAFYPQNPGKIIGKGYIGGDIIFANGANVTIEASGDILITSGFIVQSGAIVNLKAKGTVTISGGTIKAGGTLSIEASEIETSASFISEGGATLNFAEISE